MPRIVFAKFQNIKITPKKLFRVLLGGGRYPPPPDHQETLIYQRPGRFCAYLEYFAVFLLSGRRVLLSPAFSFTLPLRVLAALHIRCLHEDMAGMAQVSLQHFLLCNANSEVSMNNACIVCNSSSTLPCRRQAHISGLQPATPPSSPQSTVHSSQPIPFSVCLSGP